MIDIHAATKTAALDGERFPVVDVGSGPAVLLLHGFPDSRVLWRHQVPALAAAGLRVIAHDLRGFGETPRPTDVRPYRRPFIVADVLGLPGLNWYRAAFTPPPPDEPPLPRLPAWGRLQSPVLGVWSEGDPFLLEPQMALSAGAVDATWRYERIPGAGHWRMLDKPEALNRLLVDFLGA